VRTRGRRSVLPASSRISLSIVDRERRVLIGCTITGSEVVGFLHPAGRRLT
jgi:hypothetical protein